jgi:hypothetical protein
VATSPSAVCVAAGFVLLTGAMTTPDLLRSTVRY